MKSKLLLAAFLLLVAIAVPSHADEALQARLLDFERRALFTREIQTRLQNIPYRSPYQKDDGTQQAAVLKLAREYATNPIPEDAIARDFFVYYGAYLQMLAGENASARATFARLVGSPTMTAEALVSYQKLDSAPEYQHLHSRERYGLFMEMLGKLLPVGHYGTSYDNMRTDDGDDDDDNGEMIPQFDFARPYGYGIHNLGRPGMIADAFSQMKLHRWAIVSSLEILYASHNLDPQQGQSWINVMPVSQWHNVTLAQWQLGNDEALAAALARVIVFSYNSRKDQALQLLVNWRENGLPQQPEAAQPDAGQLKTILELYAEMNMHPRVFELLHEFSDVIGPEAVELRAKYEKEWLKKVDFQPSQYHTYSLFGQDVGTPESQIKITVPPPLRPEAIVEAKQMMKVLEGVVYQSTR